LKGFKGRSTEDERETTHEERRGSESTGRDGFAGADSAGSPRLAGEERWRVVAKREEGAVGGENHVVQNGDAEQAASVTEPLRNFIAVFRAWAWVAARVVVQQ